MSRNEYDDHNDTPSQQASFIEPPISSLRRSRENRRRLRRAEPPPQPIYGIPSPVAAARGLVVPSQTVPSPPPREGQSPVTQIALLPGGGVEIPSGFRFDQADQGHYRTRGGGEDDGGPGQPRVLGGLGFGMLKGLKKLPAALARAGRGARPRQDTEFTPEDRQQLPIDDDVETYITQLEDDEGEAESRARQEEQLLNEYIQRHRRRRDRVWRHSERVRREHYVPAPQPVPVPGSHTPAPSAVGYSEAPPVSVLEAEEMAEELEELSRAHEHERKRNIYAAVAVRPPPSPSRTHTSRRTHHRVASTPLPSRIFSHWAAERDSVGRRLENRSNSVSPSDASPLSFTGLLRLIQQISDLPWVGERVAADYVPGGVRPLSSDYTSQPGYPGSGSSYVSPAPILPLPPGQSWYAPRDSVLVLPEGVAPPPGFVPYPHQYHLPTGEVPKNRAPSA